MATWVGANIGRILWMPNAGVVRTTLVTNWVIFRKSLRARENLPMIFMVTNNERAFSWTRGNANSPRSGSMRKCKQQFSESFLVLSEFVYEFAVKSAIRIVEADRVCLLSLLLWNRNISNRTRASVRALRAPKHRTRVKEIFYRELVGVWITDIFNDTDDVLTESNQENRVKLWCEKPTTATIVNFNTRARFLMIVCR